MKIHQLTLRGFGPFPDTVDIDFDELSADGLFLIAGPTGAGKTTLLDAICFALYGRVPGSRNDAQAFRSQFAAPDTPTTVTLEFSARGRRYRVERSPAYLRPAKRGNSMTQQRATAQLWVRGDDQWMGRGRTMSEVGTIIADAIGLSAEQFTKIIMLPQGDFAAFLKADPKEREPILQKLFGTERFARIGEVLAAAATEARARIDESDRQRLALIARAHELHAEDDATAPAHPSAAFVDAALTTATTVCAERLAVSTEVSELASATARAAEDRAAQTDARIEDRRRLLSVQRLRQALRERAAHDGDDRRDRHRSRAAAQLVAPYREAQRAAQQLESSRGVESAARSTLHDALAGLDPASPLLSAAGDSASHDGGTGDGGALRDWADRAGDAARSAETAAALFARRAELQTEAESTDHTENTARQTVDAARVAVTKAEERYDTAGRARTELEDPQQAQAHLEELEERELRRTEAKKRSESAEHEHAAAAQALLEARAAASAADEEYARVRGLRLDGIAAELAAELQAGQPCPVCGSQHHPQPAQSAPDRVTREDEDAAAQRSAVAADASHGAAHKAAQTEAAAVAARKALADSGDQDEDAAAAALEQARQRAASLAAAVSAADAELSSATQSLSSARSELEAAQSRLATATAAASAAAALLRDLSDQGLREALDDLVDAGFERPADAAAARACQQRAQAIAERARSAQQSVEASTRARAQSSERNAEFATALAESIFADEDEFRTALLIDGEAADERLAESDRLRARVTGMEEEDWFPRAAADGADTAELENDRQQAHEQAARLRERETRSHQRHAVTQERLADALRLRDGFRAQADAEEAELSEMRADVELSGLVQATSADNTERLPLSSYALLRLFGTVANNATERLTHMAGGRYRLQHDLTRHRKENRAGLGLSVFDTFTQESRDPRTLSGGESFMVALALALGLADAVAQASGGIELDTLFIDEGFGSLDPDALADVLGVLDELQHGGRRIGLISHVGAMHQTIHNTIEVRSSPTGSTVVSQSGPA